LRRRKKPGGASSDGIGFERGRQVFDRAERTGDAAVSGASDANASTQIRKERRTE
jgi:hypothetical protein